jgi:hypothetical protein
MSREKDDILRTVIQAISGGSTEKLPVSRTAFLFDTDIGAFYNLRN